MRSRWIGVLGALMIVVGLVGVALVASSSIDRSGDTVTMPGPPTTHRPRFRDSGRLSGDDASLGARIYLDGIGEDGRAIRRTAAGPGMMGGGCVNCHGIDGAGGYFPMMGALEAPDIRYSTLTSPHGHDDESAWSDGDIRRAIRDGVEPDGARLSTFMPRWELSETEFDALLDYLKELDDR